MKFRYGNKLLFEIGGQGAPTGDAQPRPAASARRQRLQPEERPIPRVEAVRRNRQQGRLNPYVLRYFRLMRKNVIGLTGVHPEWPESLRELWKAWRPDGAGRMTYRQFQRLGLTTYLRDGELVLEEQGDAFYVWDSLALDYYSGLGANQDGIEYDEAGRPLSYTFYPRGRERVTVPADRIRHTFEADYPGQTRGYPPLAAALPSLRALWDLDRAYGTGAVKAASMPGYWQTDRELETLLNTGKASRTDLESRLVIEPGVTRRVPAGVEHKPIQMTGTLPAMYDQLRMGLLTNAGAALDVSYILLAGDYVHANNSSGRLAQNESLPTFRENQELLQEIFDPVVLAFIRTLPSARLVREAMAARERPWRYPGFRYVDPTKEATAEKLSLLNRTTTISALARAQGIDPQQLFDEMERDRDDLERRGLPLPEFLARPAAPVSALGGGP